MQRMDALEQDVHFYFFEKTEDNVSTRPPFPSSGLPDAKWANLLKEKSSRDEHILSGFTADMARLKALPDDIQEWMLGEILFEHREDLAWAYVDVLESCSKHHDSSPLLDMPMLRDSLERLCAREDIVYHDTDAAERKLPPEGQRPARAGRRGLQRFLSLLSKLSTK